MRDNAQAERARPVTMVGYRSPLSKQYKVLDESGRIRHTIHVDWDEEGHGIARNLKECSPQEAYDRLRQDPQIQAAYQLELPDLTYSTHTQSSGPTDSS